MTFVNLLTFIFTLMGSELSNISFKSKILNIKFFIFILNLLLMKIKSIFLKLITLFEFKKIKIFYFKFFS
jgi:hypothetical protein